MKALSVSFLSLFLIVLVGISMVYGQGIPVPFRIGGTLTIDGIQITQDTDDGLVIKVTKPDGSDYTDINGNHPQDADGLNASNWYLIDIPIYSASNQQGGAGTGDNVIIHVYKNAQELQVTNPVNGNITVGSSGMSSQINLYATICAYTLTVNVNPSGSGMVAWSPNKSTYCSGEEVTLTATPNPGYTFSSWSGVDSDNGTTAYVSMSGNKSVTANFSQANYTLSLSKAGNGSVRVNGVLQSLPWSGLFVSGVQVQLEAVPDRGWNFANWSGDLSGSAITTSINMSGNRNVTANFSPRGYSISGYVLDKYGQPIDDIQVCFKDKYNSEIMPCVETDEDGYYIQYGFEPYDKYRKNAVFVIPYDSDFKFSPKNKAVKIMNQDVALNFKTTPLRPASSGNTLSVDSIQGPSFTLYYDLTSMDQNQLFFTTNPSMSTTVSSTPFIIFGNLKGCEFDGVGGLNVLGNGGFSFDIFAISFSKSNITLRNISIPTGAVFAAPKSSSNLVVGHFSWSNPPQEDQIYVAAFEASLGSTKIGKRNQRLLKIYTYSQPQSFLSSSSTRKKPTESNASDSSYKKSIASSPISQQRDEMAYLSYYDLWINTYGGAYVLADLDASDIPPDVYPIDINFDGLQGGFQPDPSYSTIIVYRGKTLSFNVNASNSSNSTTQTFNLKELYIPVGAQFTDPSPVKGGDSLSGTFQSRCWRWNLPCNFCCLSELRIDFPISHTPCYEYQGPGGATKN